MFCSCYSPDGPENSNKKKEKGMEVDFIFQALSFVAVFFLFCVFSFQALMRSVTLPSFDAGDSTRRV